MIKSFDLIHSWDPNRYYHSESKWTWEQWQWKAIPHSPKLQDWGHIIIEFSVMSYSSVEVVGVFYKLSWMRWAQGVSCQMEYFSLPLESKVDSLYHCIKHGQINVLRVVFWTQPEPILNHNSIIFHWHHHSKGACINL